MRAQVWLGLGLAAVVGSADVPAVVWSGSEAMLPAVDELERVQSAAVGSTVAGGSPAVGVLMVVPSGSAAAVAAGEVAAVARGASARRVLPFVEAPWDADVENDLEDAGRRFLPTTAHETVAWGSLLDHVDRATNDILVSVAPDFRAADALAAELTTKAAGRARDLGRPDAYVLGLAFAAPDGRPRRRLDDTDDTTTTAGVRMTPDILAGVLVGLLFTLTAWLGLMCIGAIQTPSQYALQGPPSLKEW